MRVLAFSLCLPLLLLSGAAVAADLAAQCRREGNDDTLRPYDPALRAGVVAAFARMFPQALPPEERLLRAQTHMRCMDGHLLACFTGANLPCGRMNTAVTNPGAANFCKANPDAATVPAYASGHDSVYTFRCRADRAEVSGTTFRLDQRGFAAAVWTPID